MNKTLFTAALACVLAMGCFAVSAKTYDPQEKVAFSEGSLTVKGPSKGSEALKVFIVNPTDKNENAIKLSEFLSEIPTIKDENSDTELSFGYMLRGADNKSKFVSLSTLLSNLDRKAADAAEITSFKLGEFRRGETIQFGYADSNGANFVKTPVALVDVKSDALYHAGFDQDSFFKLDFSEDPFQGNIEILVMGEPLPPATVTMLVALAAGAAFLFFSNRRRQARSAEQA